MGATKQVNDHPNAATILRAWGLLATIVGAVGGGAGCGGPSGQFYVVQNQVPGPGCVIPTDKGGLYQGEGTLDVRVAGGDAQSDYALFPLLQNDLPLEGEQGVEPNRIALSGFEVDVRFIDGSAAARELFVALAADPAAAALLRYQSPWSGSVDPGGGTTSASTSAFPAELVRRLRDADTLADGVPLRVEAKVRAVGSKLTGGIRSDPFSYPIRVCDGCLIRRITTCPAPAPVLQGGVCNPAQDQAIDCCTIGGELLCPATSAP